MVASLARSAPWLVLQPCRKVEQKLINAPVCVLAVDPGSSGAVFKIGRGIFTGLRDFKCLQDIAKAIRLLAQDVDGVKVDYAMIEGVAARPGQGVCSMFSFGRASGVADGALCLALPHLTVEEVWPQRWQNFFRKWLGIEKGQEFDSRAIACRLFPSQADYFKRKKDHNSADAALIAVWKLFPSVLSISGAR